MERRVVITGAGLVSALGDSPLQLHCAMCEGRSGLHPLEGLGVDRPSCGLGANIVSFSAESYLKKKNLRPLDRTGQLVAVAAQLALEDSGWTTEQLEKQDVGLVLGTFFGSVHTISEFDRHAVVAGPSYASPMDFANTVINAAAGQAAIWHGLRGVNSTVSAGTTSGLLALGYAADLIRNGRGVAILAGGADELCFESFLGFQRAGLLCGTDGSKDGFPIPFDRRRNGFALAEAAGLLMLEDADSATARGARVRAEIKGYGSAFDCARGTHSEKAIEVIVRAMRLALIDAELTPEEIDCLSASANGSVLRDRHEAVAITRMFDGRTDRVPVTAIKSMTGEALGASGALQAADLLETMGDGVLPGIPLLEQVEDGLQLVSVGPKPREVNARSDLINSVGLDGNCSSLVLARTGI